MQSLIRSQLLGRLDVARTFASGAILSLVCVLTIPLGFAQSVDYVGRAFKVDSFKELDGENVAVEVAGQTLFASRGGVGRATFKMYAQKPELLLSDGGLKGYATWLATLPSKGDEEGAILGVEHVVVSSEIKAGEKITFYGELVDSPGGERMLFRTVSALSGSEAGACSALAFLSAESQRALKSGGHEWVSQRCPQPLVDMAREVLMEGYRDPGIAMLRTAALFSGNGGIGDAARTSISRLEAIERALLSQDPAELDSALKVASFDALLSAYFEDTRPAVVTEFSVRALREGHPIVALRGLSLLDFSVRNTSHHELVSRALEQVPFEDRADVRNSSVRSLLSSYSMKDEFVKRRYEAILEAWIRRLVDNDKPGEALSFFELLKEVRPDPSPENDAWRGVIAECFVDNRDEGSADGVLAGLRAELPWIYRFRLLLKRDVYILIMVVLGGVVVLRWGIMFIAEMRRRHVTRRIAHEAERRATEAAERERYHSQFAAEALRADGFMDVDEYAASLKKFHLHTSASLADIKNAYRNVVKTLHPDINPRATKEDTDTFIDLTKTYERILVLHAEREHRAKPSK